ncbi:parallel beta-helix repeat-containing protein [Caballeronia turbans]|nr:parallel beta-helix repeat-containing protein [Caballeronia turbans]
MTTINDLCVASSFSDDDKLPMWQTANGITRALPLSVLTAQFLTNESINQLAASPTVEKFAAGPDFTPGTTIALTLANSYLSGNNIEVFFDAAFQGPDQYALSNNALAFISPIPVGVQNVYVRGGAARLTDAPSDGTVTDAKVANGSKLLNRIKDTIDVKDFGAVGDGVTDDTAAFSAAFAYARTFKSSNIFIPPGTFVLSSQLVYNMPSATAAISLFGSGSDVTELTWAAGAGMVFNFNGNFNSVHIRDMSITTGTAGIGNPAISLIGPSSPFQPQLPAQSDITNVTFRGSDGYQMTNYWSTDVLVQCAHNVNCYNTQFVGPSGVGGYGFHVFGTPINPAYPFNFTSCSFNHRFAGIYIGTQVQGITVNQCNFTAAVGVGSSYGILSDATAQASSLVQLSVTGSQFTVNSAAVFLPVGVTGTNINDNFIFVPPGAFGIDIQGALFTITGNNIIGQSTSGTTGITIGGQSLGPGVITGNQMNSLGLAVFLGPQSSNVNVQSNIYGSNTTNVNNGGTGNTVGGGSA